MSRRSLLALVLLWSAFAAVCFPLIRSSSTSNYQHDEQHYHLPAVRQIAAHWPALDLNADSLSATAPGYHYVLASIAKITGSDTQTMRLVNWAISALTLTLLFFHARRHCGDIDAALFVLPLALSNFFVKSASWVVTDNAALLLVVAALLAALRQFRSSSAVALPALFGALSVFIRQMNIWTAVLAPAAAFPARYRGPTAPSTRLFFATITTLLPFAVLLVLVLNWHGLVPAAWRDESLRLSCAGPAYGLSVFALFAWFYPSITSTPGEPHSSHLPPIVAFIAGAALSLISATTPSHEFGRWGGYLWNLAERLPSFADRSVLFPLLAGLGAVAVLQLWSALNKSNTQAARVFLAATLCWLATFLVNRQVFHRYFEPTVLVLLIVFGSLLGNTGTNPVRRSLALLACSFAQLAITLATAYSAVFR